MRVRIPSPTELILKVITAAQPDDGRFSVTFGQSCWDLRDRVARGLLTMGIEITDW
jgi:hypothetical protein